MGKLVKIITSGTGIDRASKSLMNQKIDDVLSVSYTEMLMSKHGESKYFNEDFLDELDPEKNKLVYNFLKDAQKNKNFWKQTLKHAPDVNFWKLVFPQKHIDLIHSTLEDDDLTGWSKILSDVNKNQNILKPIILGLWGKASVREDSFNKLDISNAIEREPKVVQFFVGAPSNKELNKLSAIFKSCLPNHIVRVLSGDNDATNSSSEEIVKLDIQKCREENKEGVVIISTQMGSRSFSVSETDAVVLMFDNGSVASLIQKISRALTGGKDYFGNDKTCGNVISLSLDPNRVDSVDVYVVEEAQKNKIQSESFNQVVKRIRRSVNIFTLDDNGDKVELLTKDDYYSELIEKFNFEKLKNSQINLIPLITDEELRSSLLGIKSSEVAKNIHKTKLLKGKGKKFLDSNDNNSSDSDEQTQEFEKIDYETLKQAILTINNSLLSITSIDGSAYSKEKSFRSVLKSIQSDDFKIKEFIDLYGIKPSVVIELLDREVVNENVIDICLSKF